MTDPVAIAIIGGIVAIVQSVVTVVSTRNVKSHVDRSNTENTEIVKDKVDKKVDEIQQSVRESMTIKASQIADLVSENQRLGGSTTADNIPIVRNGDGHRAR